MASNIYLFLGNEQLITQNKIKKIINDLAIEDMNVETYDMNEAIVSDVINSCLTPPFLGEKKAVIMRNPLFLTNSSLSDKEKSFILRYLNSPLDSTTLIINAVSLKLDEKSDVVKLIKKVSDTRTTNIDEREMNGWLTMFLRSSDVDIDEAARKLFFDYVGKDMETARNEALKLICYLGPNKEVSVKDVETVVSRSNDTPNYELTNAIINGETKKAIDIYLSLISSGVKGDYLFNIIALVMRRILIAQAMVHEKAKQTDIAAALQISSNQAYYIMQNAKKIPKEKLLKTIFQLGELDCKVKTGKMEVGTALEYLVFKA